MGIDVWEMLDAAFTKPFGIMPFYPGPGVGGHCIPIDPHYLEWKAKEYGFNTRLINLAGEINRSMPFFIVERVRAILNKQEKSIKGAKVLVVGLAYKANLADYRESPSVDIINLLQLEGAELVYHDPFVPEVFIKEQAYCSVPLTANLVEAQDCVLILTNHEGVDYKLLQQHSSVILDAKNVYHEPYSNLIKL
jgi:nucleotide sugar dehydrogenase